MDEKQLRAIQARCGAATPGPWVASYNYSNVVEFDLYSSVKMFSCGPTLQGSWDAIGPQAIADAAFIAAARQDVPALLAEIDALRRQLAECQAQAEEAQRESYRRGADADRAVADARRERDAARAEAVELRRQLAETQDSAANGWARAAASPALIEEYARACHYAGSSGLAMVDWPQWLSQRATRE